MKILDRYIIRTFLVSTVLWLVVMMMLRIVIDLFINMDEFIEQSDSLGKALGIIAEFYSYQSLVYFNEMGGLIVLFGAITTLYIMNHTNELVAMLASGVSLHRVIFPVILCAMALSGLIVVDQELLMPRVAHKLARGQSEVETTKGFAIRLVTDGSGTAWYSPWFDPATETMQTPEVFTRREDLSLLSRASGETAKAAVLDSVTGWALHSGRLEGVSQDAGAWENLPTDTRVFSTVEPAGLLELAGVPQEDKQRRVSISLRDFRAWDAEYGMIIRAEHAGPWVKRPGREGTWTWRGKLTRPMFEFWSRLAPDEKEPTKMAPAKDAKLLGVFQATSATWVPRSAGEEGALDDHWMLEDGSLFCPSNLTPYDLVLRQSSRWLDFMSISALQDLTARRQIPEPALAELAIHVRLTQPLVSIVMLLLGLPFILSRERNIKASALLCLLVVLVFYVFVYACRYVGLPPAWAAWLPIILFGPVAVVMVDSIKT